MAKRRVFVVERGSDKVVHTQVITIDTLNAPTARKDFEDAAWQTAIEDGDVSGDAKRSDYRFVIEEAT